MDEKRTFGNQKSLADAKFDILFLAELDCRIRF